MRHVANGAFSPFPSFATIHHKRFNSYSATDTTQRTGMASPSWRERTRVTAIGNVNKAVVREDSVGHVEFEEESKAGSSSDTSIESSDTDDEIAAARVPLKSTKTQKRKRRATSPSQFGTTLRTLLETNVSTDAPLALKPSIARNQNREKLDVRAKKLLEGEKKEKEETNHIVDVIGGWGGESERALRKTAQRGGSSFAPACYQLTLTVKPVVRLFNVIQQTQAAAAAEKEDAKAHRGSGKPSLDAPSLDSPSKRKKRKAHAETSKPAASTGKTGSFRISLSNVNRGVGVGLGQEDFLNMIKSGGIVSTT